MAFLPSLPEAPHLSDVITRFPKHWAPLMTFHDILLRGPSPFTIGERELIAAYVSGLNACHFCHGAHAVYAEAFGVDGAVFDALLADLDSAGVDARLKPVLAFARKLTLDQARMTPADARAILDAGWPEEAVNDVTMVTATFNFMNRVIHGHGVEPNPELLAARRQAMVANKSPAERQAANDTELGSSTYTDFGRELGILD